MSESVKAYRSFFRTTIRAGGTQFVDVRDLAALLVHVLEKRHVGRIVAAGHYFSWDDLTALLEQVTGAQIKRLAAPGWVLRLMGSAADALSGVTGRSFPLSREGLEIATRWRPIPDSPDVAALGVTWRDPQQTIADLARSLLAKKKLRPAVVPRIAGEQATQQARS
jgi:nucleoside-diphosphate-sugar epimerase